MCDNKKLAEPINDLDKSIDWVLDGNHVISGLKEFVTSLEEPIDKLGEWMRGNCICGYTTTSSDFIFGRKKLLLHDFAKNTIGVIHGLYYDEIIAKFGEQQLFFVCELLFLPDSNTLDYAVQYFKVHLLYGNKEDMLKRVDEIARAAKTFQNKIDSDIEKEIEKREHSKTISNKRDWEKGNEFESFIISLFDLKNRHYFKFLQWQGDKCFDGLYPESNRHPDLVFEISASGQTNKFAVECKWRKAFRDKKIEWTTAEKLDIYKSFSKEEHMPVFLALGVGGDPIEPETLFIIPLERISGIVLNEDELSEYKRADTKKLFYYDIRRSSLR